MANRLGKDGGSAILKFVAIDRRDHRVAQTERLNRFCHTQRLFVIDRMRPAGGHGTVVASSRADIAENQKRRRARIPTFPHIRTTRFLTDRVQLEPIHGLANVVIIRTGLQLHLEPGRQAARRSS